MSADENAITLQLRRAVTTIRGLKSELATLKAERSPPIAVVGDATADGGTITNAGQNFVRFNGHLAAVDGGQATGPEGPTTLIGGSSIVTINGKPLARLGDITTRGTPITTGQNNITAT